jgi:hypothetical protein
MVQEKFGLDAVNPARPAVAELVDKVPVPGRQKAQVPQLGLGPLADLIEDAEHREGMGA